MIYKIVSVHDRAADAFGRPIFVNTVGQAIRSFQDEINRAAEDNTMFNHPDDYDLYELGEFNDQTGMFNNHEQVQLAIGKQMQLKSNGETK